MDLWLLVFLLVIGLPVIGHYRFTRLSRRPGVIPTRVKLRLYLSVVVTQWALVAACAWVLARRGLGLADLGLGPPPGFAVFAAAAVTAWLAATSLLGLRSLARDPDAELPSHLRKVGRILPVTGRERAGYTVLALTAGVCEEILYRGFLIYSLDGLLPSSGWSAALAAVLFGAAHAYQGLPGVVSTGLLGGFLGAIYVLGGSLWPGIGLHAVVDLVNGYALGPVARLRWRGWQPHEPRAPEPSAAPEERPSGTDGAPPPAAL